LQNGDHGFHWGSNIRGVSHFGFVSWRVWLL
jgi:hypothetical protein